MNNTNDMNHLYVLFEGALLDAGAGIATYVAKGPLKGEITIDGSFDVKKLKDCLESRGIVFGPKTE